MFLCRVYPVQLLPFIGSSLGGGGIYKLTSITLTITLQWPLVNKRRFTCKVNPY